MKIVFTCFYDDQCGHVFWCPTGALLILAVVAYPLQVEVLS